MKKICPLCQTVFENENIEHCPECYDKIKSMPNWLPKAEMDLQDYDEYMALQERLNDPNSVEGKRLNRMKAQMQQTNNSYTKHSNNNTASKSNNTTEVATIENRKGELGCLMVIIIAIICVIIFFISLGSKNHNDGICDYCNNPGKNRLGDEEFCDKHYLDRMGDIIEWSDKNNN